MPQPVVVLSSVPAAAVAPRSPSAEILGASQATRELRDLIDRVAGSDACVLITGESGSGKELVARQIHQGSRRRHHPFVAINCAALTPSLLDSELSGHVRGAFTDAKRAHDGLFVQAGHGTIFLDEIGEMPLEMQAKLLRMVEQRVVRPVGSDAEVPIEARVIAATNRDLEAAVAAGRFRHDLYFRINVVDVPVPPLRERPEDIAALARHFAGEFARRIGREPPRVGDRAIRCLQAYAWPGNVRELENCIQRAVTLSRTSAIEADDLPRRLRCDTDPTALTSAPLVPEALVTLDELERRYIGRVLETLGGNMSRAARVLGVDRRTMYRLAHRLGVDFRRKARPA